ncbi:protocadherin alpha-11-like [Mizuhopecten yessoensis]|uniref:Protocadherin-9 n=1 Tax=Mizuhopecten yessoensis TaxID=6573 RepID=A0A210PLF0_MIZYE|nr:protocadherin alpha-11-like [Mizuhopecten yessoensis]XP_021339022.1 protocadherin alpha-11-like [Mizuhopecten yessoensis]XP_021339023.1 protocadherin alpha-11-like [Mizuhopecten yessoensis]XP_021339024.1 protocadherin alpha-11-like [Mizuhopecten yessoensis]XP_021339025.1 protocadherin alpha-11-like [Mizuhopecten yessoensis]XP_021339026.1 protocadherin alpha-11-like [Mizuhopecten yessoensis]OWF37311.1 Protocadherin-9 [Mizuhopecten yessoensis]
MLSFKFPLVLFCVFLTILTIFAKDLNYPIPEEEYPNYYIGNIREDFNLSSYFLTAELDDYETLKYSILSQTTVPASYFNINEWSSSLFTSQKLDRESLDHCEFSTVCELAIDVIAKGSKSTFFKKIKVNIFLLDINDNTPTFTVNRTNLEVSEAFVVGSSIPIDGAVDRDSSVNSVQSYNISERNVPFSVKFDKYVDGSSSVKIIIDSKLDSETRNFYRLHVLAIDGAVQQRTGTMTVDIKVTDVNDNAPEFSQSVYNVTIGEDTRVGQVILKVTATDADSGANGQVLYRLSPHQLSVIHTFFAIDNITGELSLVQPLVYERGEVYQIFIEATDNATKPIFTQATVYVSILDSSNDPPEININLLSNADVAKISEDANIGAAVAHIGVTDDDKGINGIVTCRVQSYYFTLDAIGTNEYKVVVHKPLNRELMEKHRVKVICEDSGSPSLNSTAEFEVKVLDENDHAPKFTQQVYRPDIAENNQYGAILLKVSTNDFDAGINAEVIYSLVPTNNDKFSIDPDSGEVFVNVHLDRENVTQLEFVVIATDKGIPPKTGTASVRVRVLDENDNRPNFSETVYTFSVRENLSPRVHVGTLSASDPDEGQNGSVEFMMLPEMSGSFPFIVYGNGSIYTTQVLNRELQPHGYNFRVIAYDLGSPSQNSTSHVTVFVGDINDNGPVIVFPTFDNKTVKIVYNTGTDHVIAKVIAYDPDLGGNSKLSYTILGDDSTNPFYIDENTGEIYLAQPLGISDIQTYTFTVLVEDNGIPRRSSMQNLTIIVTTQGGSGGDTPSDTDNLVIAIVITCVTIVLSMAIILVICIIKRIDRQRKAMNKSAGSSDSDDKRRDMYDAISRNVDNDSRDRAEKKVSFSVDSDPNLIISASDTSSKFPNTALGVEEILDRIMPPPKPERGTPREDNPDPQFQQQPLSTVAKLQRHQDYLQACDKPSWGSNPNLEGEMYKRQEDNHSETSGETSTSDSGRGGSESDIQSSGGLSHCLELDYLKNMYTPSNSPRKDNTSASGDGADSRRVPSNSENSDPRRVPNPNHLHFKHGNMLPPKSRTVHLNSHINGYPSRGGVPHKGRGPVVHWRGVADYLNTSMATIEDYDEDDNTTTSGSYVVEEDDLRTDMAVGMDCFV